jgi:dTDP-4-amino-4,6-dideoxygalactose transaminase
MLYIKFHNLADRTAFIAHMRERDVQCVFHYVPLHSAPAGLRFGEFVGEDRYTTSESDRLVRLPMYYRMSQKDCDTVIQAALDYFKAA